MNFKPWIITKQSNNNRKIHEVHHIDVTPSQDEIKINEAHVRNANYKGKNYDPNYWQNRTKTNVHTPTNIKSPQYWKPRFQLQQKQPAGQTSKCIHHAAWASQQRTAVQDPGGTKTPITVQR